MINWNKPDQWRPHRPKHPKELLSISWRQIPRHCKAMDFRETVFGSSYVNNVEINWILVPPDQWSSQHNHCQKRRTTALTAVSIITTWILFLTSSSLSSEWIKPTTLPTLSDKDHTAKPSNIICECHVCLLDPRREQCMQPCHQVFIHFTLK